jgi:branched-chain amino acid aminotransferase
MQKIRYELKENRGEISLPEKLGFGVVFTDHMFEMDYDPKQGWHNPVIKQVQDLSLHPATMFIHYGQAIFEGLKAFRTVEGDIAMFRVDEHVARLNKSAKRMCIPEIDASFVINALKELITIDKDWVPAKEGESLYIRPFIYGADPFLGVRPSSKYKLVIILSPVGAYYPEGFKPVKILVQDEYVRAVRKGLGECKAPANYAASLLVGEEAKKNGYTQVLWLDAVELKYIEEVGTMNIFIRFRDEVVTPKLTGGILPGVTRKSVLSLLKDWGIKASERLISIDELTEEYKKGNVLGIFGTGTAAVISSVGWLKYNDMEMTMNNGQPDDLAIRLFDEITSIQYAKKEDTNNWLTYVVKQGVEVL